MFDPKKLQLGDRFYGVKSRSQPHKRKKIIRIIDGEEWFRYDLPSHIFEVVTYDIMGVLNKSLEGMWLPSEEDDLIRDFNIVRTDSTHQMSVTYSEADFGFGSYFFDLEEAKQYAKKLEEENDDRRTIG